MDIRELDKVLSLALEESLDDTSIDELIEQEIKENGWETEILAQLDKDEKIQIISNVVDNYGYTIYDNALVFNVKGRPNIHYTDADIPAEEYNLALSDFSNSLANEHEDFVTLGRSAGYWGIDNLSDKLVISEDGINVIKKEILKHLNAPDEEYVEAMKETEDVPSLVRGVIYDVLNDYYTDFAYELCNYTDSLDIAPELIKEMTDISTAIDAKETEMDTAEFWAGYGLKLNESKEVPENAVVYEKILKDIETETGFGVRLYHLSGDTYSLEPHRLSADKYTNRIVKDADLAPLIDMDIKDAKEYIENKLRK